MMNNPLPFSIIVPTYCEAENIPVLAERVRAALAGCAAEWELLLVDDDSNDGSERIVAELSAQLPIRIVVRRDAPRNLALAVLEGMRVCKFDRIVVMDADLSHPPERITDLLAALGDEDGDGGQRDAGNDDDSDERLGVMAIGSRYVSSGGFDRGWSLWRFLNSHLATMLARPLVTCSDPMSGFFAVDRRALPNTAQLQPLGYKIALELMVRGRLRVKEVPIVFTDRDLGTSKMNWRQQWNYLRHLRRLYMHRFDRLMRVLSFGVVGASGFVIDIVCYFALQWMGFDHRLARALSFWPAMSWNWYLNRRVTFSERPRRPRMRQWAEFTAGSLVGIGVNVGSYLALTEYVDLFARHRLLALVCGVGLGALVNFIISTLYVYRQHSAVQGLQVSRGGE